MSSRLRSFTMVAALFLILATTESAFAQQVRERQLIPSYDLTTIQMPVEILSIKLKEKEAQPGKMIFVSDEWLRGLTFTLKNISDKPIAHVAVTLSFHNPEYAPHPKRIIAYYLSYGIDFRDPRAALWEKAPRAIQPGETMDLVLSNDKYPVLLKMLAHGNMSPDISVVRYSVDAVAFENEPDIVWRGGKLLRRDTNDPDKFKVMERYTLLAKRM